MHNSQDGAAVVYEYNIQTEDYNFAVEAPNSYLLISDCAGCHSSADQDTIVGGLGSSDGGTPIVFSTSDFNNPLAGGNFSYILDGNVDADTYGHNVDFIKGQDLNLSVSPGGTMSSQLTCAGKNGCHGDRSEDNNYLAIKTAHHTDDTAGITGASIGLSYRFLDGILGTEDNNWEQDNDNASHNEYKGSIGVDDTTISSLCAQCHGDFHGPSYTNTSSPFIRHPTDTLLPARDEYTGYTSYSMLAPLARPDPPVSPDTSSATVTPDIDIVMCLSCHRAHASPYYKILRWDIKDTLAEALSGCNVCHRSKD